MRSIHRVVLLIGLIAPVLSACADFDMDKLDIFGLNEKKKLPGDRKAVFPEGVPGVSQGIPPEYMKGYQPTPDTPLTAEGAPDNPAAAADPSKKTAAVQPTEEPKPKPKRKPKPRPPVQPAAQQNSQQQPWPAQDQQQQPQQQGQNSNTAPWPAAPAPGTFSR
jgi:hypothetical protein